MSPSQFRRTMLLLWIALTLTQVVFAAVVLFLRFSDFSIDEMLYYDSEKLPFIVGALSAFVLSFAVIFVLRGKSMQDEKIIDQQKYATAHILTWAITETITLMGLVVALSRNSNSFLPFFFVAIATMILHFPKETLNTPRP